jgi:hypothetical protein
MKSLTDSGVDPKIAIMLLTDQCTELPNPTVAEVVASMERIQWMLGHTEPDLFARRAPPSHN